MSVPHSVSLHLLSPFLRLLYAQTKVVYTTNRLYDRRMWRQGRRRNATVGVGQGRRNVHTVVRVVRVVSRSHIIHCCNGEVVIVIDQGRRRCSPTAVEGKLLVHVEEMSKVIVIGIA